MTVSQSPEQTRSTAECKIKNIHMEETSLIQTQNLIIAWYIWLMNVAFVNQGNTHYRYSANQIKILPRLPNASRLKKDPSD